MHIVKVVNGCSLPMSELWVPKRADASTRPQALAIRILWMDKLHGLTSLLTWIATGLPGLTNWITRIAWFLHGLTNWITTGWV